MIKRNASEKGISIDQEKYIMKTISSLILLLIFSSPCYSSWQLDVLNDKDFAFEISDVLFAHIQKQTKDYQNKQKLIQNHGNVFSVPAGNANRYWRSWFTREMTSLLNIYPFSNGYNLKLNTEYTTPYFKNKIKAEMTYSLDFNEALVVTKIYFHDDTFLDKIKNKHRKLIFQDYNKNSIVRALNDKLRLYYLRKGYGKIIVAILKPPIQYVRLRSIGKPLEISQIGQRFKELEFTWIGKESKVVGNFLNDFIDNNDGTITDRATNLMWKKRIPEERSFVKPQKVSTMDKVGSLIDKLSGIEKERFLVVPDYIKDLNKNRFAGYDDWRIPTIEELGSLVTFEGFSSLFIKGRVVLDFWSSDYKVWGSGNKAELGYYYQFNANPHGNCVQGGGGLTVSYILPVRNIR